MRLAVIIVPVIAPAGVTARSFHVTSPSSTLSPVVQISTGADRFAHPKHAITASVPTKGTTTSNTSVDCQASFPLLTLHRILSRNSPNARSTKALTGA